MKNLYNCFVGLLIVASCASKEEIYYLQDASDRGAGKVEYSEAQIQPNDILKINVNSLEPSTVIPYLQPK